jgi:hypothetical protein
MRVPQLIAILSRAEMADRLVTIARYPNAASAEIARIRLEESGIAVRIVNAETVTALWHVGTALGDVQLVVAEEHAERASGLLSTLEPLDESRQATEAADGTPLCLACGAEFPTDTDRCPACGWSYGNDPDADAAATAREDDDEATPDPDDAAPMESPTRTLTQVRDVGMPFLSLWVAMTVAALILGFLACTWSLLDEMFR